MPPDTPVCDFVPLHRIDASLPILDMLAMPVFVLDRQHRCQIINEAFVNVFDRPREHVMGKTVFEFLPSEQARQI